MYLGTFHLCTMEVDEMDEYLRVSAVFHLSDSGDYSHSSSSSMKIQRKERSLDFGNIFKTACDELKEHAGTHTKTGVMTLS